MSEPTQQRYANGGWLPKGRLVVVNATPCAIPVKSGRIKEGDDE